MTKLRRLLEETHMGIARARNLITAGIPGHDELDSILEGVEENLNQIGGYFGYSLGHGRSNMKEHGNKDLVQDLKTNQSSRPEWVTDDVWFQFENDPYGEFAAKVADCYHLALILSGGMSERERTTIEAIGKVLKASDPDVYIADPEEVQQGTFDKGTALTSKSQRSSLSR